MATSKTPYLMGAHVWARWPRILLGERGVVLHKYQGRDMNGNYVFSYHSNGVKWYLSFNELHRNMTFFRPFLLDKRADDIECYL